MLFLLALLALMLYQLRRDIRIVDRLKPAGVLHSPIKRAGMIFLVLLVVPFLVVHTSGLGGILRAAPPTLWSISIGISFLMSYTWYRYLTWLDPFEREALKWEGGLFLVAGACTFLTFPLSDLVVPGLQLRADGNLWNDWWYSVIGIGLVEESVKLFPLLLLMAFSRQVDEPFDLILYGSICALGFAFVENSLYLGRTGLHAVGGRVLFASVAHMFFTSIVAYSIAIARHRGWSVVLHGSLGLIIAAIAHGFYDLWLLSPGRPYVLTMLFFLANIHLWVVMKNNLVNLSPHYQERMRPQPTMFRYRIINALLAIFMFTYGMKFLMEGREQADALLAGQGTTMAATLLFLAISFSSFRFIPGHIAPLRPQGGLWKLLLPPIHWGEDITGRKLLLRIPEARSDARHYLTLHHMLPLEGLLARRVILDGDPDWYLFQPDRPIPFPGAYGEALLIGPHRTNDTIPDDRYVVVVAMAFIGQPQLTDGTVRKEQLEFTGFVHGKLL